MTVQRLGMIMRDVTGRTVVHSRAALFAGSAIVFAASASAQIASGSDTSGTLGEIVVTAQKRASTVQDTPISITAVSGADIQDRGITDVAALAAATPGVSLKSNGPGQTEVEMRGPFGGAKKLED